ncbi:MAG: hypothetical protein P1P60_00245 [Treponema phagedenis]|uniref:hypothetical protein n=1 Tax=Treponema phagedenis TaxID=162 RepID=UPI0031341B4F
MKIYTSEDIKVEYSGTVIYKDCFVGENSVHSLVSDFKKNNIDFSELYGCFSIVIHNVLDASVTFFCDNMGYMPIYYTVTGIPHFSRSLIDIVERTRQSEKDIDWNALFSFLEFGFCCSNLTFFKNIKKCTGDCIYRIENDRLHILNKDFKYIKIESIDTYVKQLKKMLSAFKNEKLLFDITGGTDSRLLVCLAESIGLNYELFVRGHSEAIDIKIAKEIAVLLNKSLHVMEAKAFEEFTSENFLRLFDELDGMYMPLEGFQLLDAYKERQKTGCAYNIGGLGGEYYKTFWLLRNKKVDGSYTNAVLSRKKLNTNDLHCSIQEVYYKYSNNLINVLDIEDKSKLSTYINWYRKHFFPRKSGALYGIASKYTSCYPPLPECVFYSWVNNMSIKLRMLTRFYCVVITQECPKLNLIRTLSGISLSSYTLKKLLNDIYVISARFIKRAASRFFTGKMYNPFIESVSAVADENSLKDSKFLNDVFCVLQEKKILSNHVNIFNLDIDIINRYLVIWFWLQKISA